MTKKKQRSMRDGHGERKRENSTPSSATPTGNPGGGRNHRKKKDVNRAARETEVYLGLVKLSERYVGLEVDREGMVLNCEGTSWEYDVLVSGKISVLDGFFDLKEEEDRNNLIRLLGSRNGSRLKRVEEMASSEGKDGYGMFAEFIRRSENFHLNGGGLLVHSKRNVYRHRILEDFGFEVQIYGGKDVFDLTSPDFEKDLILFLTSKRKYEKDF